MMARSGKDAEQDFRPMDPRLKKQIAIVFILSVIGSSIMIFSAVVEKTEKYMEEEKKKTEAALTQEAEELEPAPVKAE
ncbi:MAG: hypothetical protein ACOH5I_16325 [Oligoflexus sp.]